MTYIIASEKSWNKELIERLRKKIQANWIMIDKRENLNSTLINEISPDKIFFPHWSYMIPPEVYEMHECIVFHITDLPFGRGGSPLQNLILRGFSDTKISALKVVGDIDAGDIYLKKNLSLQGSAREIFSRADATIETMIVDIVNKNIKPEAQIGDPVFFKRRKPHESNISELTEVKEVFDYIRMLDADSYPPAFIESKNFSFEFSDAIFNNIDNTITASVRINKK